MLKSKVDMSIKKMQEKKYINQIFPEAYAEPSRTYLRWDLLEKSLTAESRQLFSQKAPS